MVLLSCFCSLQLFITSDMISLLPDKVGRSVTQASIDTESLRSFCSAVRFKPGDILRHKGHHYSDMYLMVDGSVSVDRQLKGAPEIVIAGSGSPIGEIGFLHGGPATATVTAKTATSALLIDDSTFAKLEKQQPPLAVQVLRQLAFIAEERMSDNLILDSTAKSFSASPEISVLLCRNKAMLEKAQRLRYTVYCEELGRQSPYADHTKKIIADDLDIAGHTFLAIENGETIGTVRLNLCCECPVGILEELYGMRASKHHPEATAVCTKFIVKKAKRGGVTSLKLISAVARYGMRSSVKETYIDCVPALLPYYKAIGFTVAGEPFFHRENGLSHPMMLEVARHGRRLSNERSVREYLNVIMKAQFFKLVDSVHRA
jgi:CRP-like cAMP-binding protein